MITAAVVGFVVGAFFGMGLAACFVVRRDSEEKREEDAKWIKQSSQK